MALILGIESTCDETAAAFVEGGRRVLGETIASQVDLHAIYGGVVPEIASRAHIENLLPTLARTAEAAGRSLEQADAIAVAHRPGLIGSLVVGLTAAKTLAWALSKPLVGVDHVHAHLYSVMLAEEATERRSDDATKAQKATKRVGTADSTPFLRAGEVPSAAPAQRGGERPGDLSLSPDFPAVGLVVSGGHTALYHVRSWTDIQSLGRTIDDAVGEAYDKVASILNLGYPGGPIIDSLAREGDPRAVRFPRSMLGKGSLDFSFSGLKTAVLYHVRGYAGRQREASRLSQQEVRDVCASFQAACVDTLVRKLRRAIEAIGARSVIVGGGVSANSALRAALPSLGLPVHVPALRYCTDNAAMTAGLADVLLREGRTSALDLDAQTLSAI